MSEDVAVATPFRTATTVVVRYSFQAVCDGVLKTPMVEGWSQAHDRLDGLLAPSALG
ncbi:hypothetical protein [Elioraea sp.]|uniref:hypothetical protein n=1 Tax=Elioraea sp. TaxID=2185103 RepID=UPI003F6EF9D7